MKPPPPPFSLPVIHCPSCQHGVDPHGADPGGRCGVGDAQAVPCECLWSPNDIAATLRRDTWDQGHEAGWHNNQESPWDDRAVLAEALLAERARVERVRAVADKWATHRENWYFSVPIFDALDGAEQQGADK